MSVHTSRNSPLDNVHTHTSQPFPGTAQRKRNVSRWTTQQLWDLRYFGVMKVTKQQMEADWRTQKRKERRNCKSYSVLEVEINVFHLWMLLRWIKVKNSSNCGEGRQCCQAWPTPSFLSCIGCVLHVMFIEMLCCIWKTLKMQSKAVAANHSHISQVVPTLHNDSFVWVSNHSTNQSAWSLSLLPNWGRSWHHYLDQNQSLAHFSFIFHPSKSHTGAADTAGKFPPPSASGNFGSVKLSGHMAGCTLELHMLFILSTRFIIHWAWSFRVRALMTMIQFEPLQPRCDRSHRENVINYRHSPGELCHSAAGREAWRWWGREEGVAEEVINQGDSLHHPGIPPAGKPTHILQGWDKATFLYGPLLTPSSTSHHSEVVKKTFNVVKRGFPLILPCKGLSVYHGTAN